MSMIPITAEHSPTTTIVDRLSGIPLFEQQLEAVVGGDSLSKSSAPGSSQKSESALEFVTWDGPDDPQNPKNWSYAYKWWVTLVVCIICLDVTFASSAPTSALHAVAHEMHVSTETANLVTTMFLIGYVVGPPIWGPGSELLGRKYVSLIALGIYAIFQVGQARAQNIGTLLVTRFLGGLFACAPLTNAGGIIADMWDPVGRGHALAIFTASVFIGPVLGPVIGGYITTSNLGWRWIFWVLMICAGACTVFGFAFLPETYAPTLLAQKARRLRKLDPVANNGLLAESETKIWTPREILRLTILRPFTMMFVEPILALITIYISLVYGIVYSLFEAYPLIFIGKRGLTIPQNGLMFIGIGIGAVLSVFVTWFFSRSYPQLIKEWRGFPPPEKRLPMGMIAGPMLVIGTLWLGWTGNYASIPWYVPALGTIFVGMSAILIFISFLSYILDSYITYAASAFAANTMIRSGVAAAFPLFTTQMFNGMGINWASTLIAGISLLLAPVPFIFYKYGPRIRAGSSFAPCTDLIIAKELAAEREERKAGEVYKEA
ncbi:MFS polyamine transporter [Multifurca ochricompacta]|uniref:MFS polyamine transporter n=1 Tax=Multifurca ochricompacta TaxID=376703 RepID=A0AAD4LZW5_9AGAM|nr:MFS polyamine transporter [Multifurca ochricompacta]